MSNRARFLNQIVSGSNCTKFVIEKVWGSNCTQFVAAANLKVVLRPLMLRGGPEGSSVYPLQFRARFWPLGVLKTFLSISFECLEFEQRTGYSVWPRASMLGCHCVVLAKCNVC